jgi:hypothetical protein
VSTESAWKAASAFPNAHNVNVLTIRRLGTMLQTKSSLAASLLSKSLIAAGDN